MISVIAILSLTYDAINPVAVKRLQARNQPWIGNGGLEDVHNGGQGLVKRDAEVLLSFFREERTCNIY